MKIIFSRKGFDSSYGGHPSPILPDGTMLSIPIPNKEDEIVYNQLCSPNGQTYWEILHELLPNKKMRDKKKSKLISQIGSYGCHLDPDLTAKTIARKGKWIGSLGQIDQSQSHLNKQGIEVGDLFLFFGWFRETVGQKGKLIFWGSSTGFHAFWGYLQIGEIWNNVNEAKTTELCCKYPGLFFHPHCRNRKRFKGTRSNTIYIARPKLMNTELPGAGTFKYPFKNDSNLILTKQGSSKRTQWDLDREIFKHLKITYHSKKCWEKEYFQSRARGQEFVVHTDKQAVNWAKRLIVYNSRRK